MNKCSREVKELLDSMGCNPIEGMARLAQDPKNTPDLRGRMFAELSKYVKPQLKSVEHSGGATPIAHELELGATAAELLRARIAQSTPRS